MTTESDRLLVQVWLPRCLGILAARGWIKRGRRSLATKPN